MQQAASQLLSIFAPNPSLERGRRTCLAISPDHKTLAYCTKRCIVMRDLQNFDSKSTKVINVQGPKNVTAVSFSPASDLIASGDDKGTVLLWAFNAKKQTIIKQTLDMISGGIIRSICWSEDGKRVLATSNRTPYVKLAATDLGTVGGDSGAGHTQDVLACAIRSKKPYTAATGGQDFMLSFCKLPPLKALTSAKVHKSFINAIAYNAKHDCYVSVSSDKSILFWNAQNGAQLQDVKFDSEHSMSILDVAWLSDEQRFITASSDGTLKIWSREGGKSLRYDDFNFNMFGSTLEYKPTFGNVPEEDQKQAVAVDDKVAKMLVAVKMAADNTAVGVTLEGSLSVWDIDGEDVSQKKMIWGHQASINSIIFDKQRNLIVSGDQNGLIIGWNAQTSQGLPAIDNTKREAVKSLKWSATKNVFYSSGYSKGVKRYIIQENGSIKLDKFIALQKDPSFVIPSSQKQDTVYAFLKPSTLIKIEDDKIAWEKDIGELRPEKEQVSYLILNDKSNQIFVGTKSGSIVYGNLQDLTLKSLLKSHDKKITAGEISPDCKLLATADSYRHIYVWNLQTLQSKKFIFHNSRINDLCWSEDSNTFISCGIDNYLINWDYEKGAKTRVIQGVHYGGTRACTFCNGCIATGGEDASVKLWKSS